MESTISVCMATFNGAAYIREQILSILPQLSEKDELIISDDGSTDDTLKIIAEFKDNRIVVLHHHQVKGISFKKVTHNFENALRHAKGDYIFLSDQDDIWVKDKIKKIKPLLDIYGCVQHSKYELFADNSKVRKPAVTGQDSLLRAVAGMHFAGCCIAVNRQFLDKAMPFPSSILTHDGWLACYAIYLNQYHYTAEPLLMHRVHGRNVSISDKKNSIFYSLNYRLKLLAAIFGRGKQKTPLLQ